MSLDFYPFLGRGVLVVLTLLLLVAVGWSASLLRARNVPRFWLAVLTALRVAAVGILLLMLLRPVIRIARDRPARLDRLVLVDTSASMNRGDTPNGETRLANVLQRLDDPALRRQGLRDATLHWFAFADHVRPLETAELPRLRADGAETDYAAAFEEAMLLYQWGLDDPQARRLKPRILLLSDGADRGRLDARAVAARLGVPVDVLPPETVEQEPPPQMAIADVQHTPRVLLGSELRMQVTVRQQGCAGVPARIILAEDGQTLVEQPVTFTQPRDEQRFMLQFRPDQAGVRRYALRLATDAPAAAPPLVSETGRVVTVRVETEFHDILMVEPEWRWSFPFMRRVIEGDPAFAFSGFLSRGAGVFIQFGEPKRRVNLTGFPRSLAELEGFDTIILGDVRPDELPPALITALATFVTERGKSLVVVAGPRMGSWLRYPDLTALLPVELQPGDGLVEGPVPVRISDEARSSAFFFAPDGRTSLTRWRELPEMDQMYAPLRKKPAATVLLESPARRNAFGPLIVAAVHTVGRGQVLFVATDTLWKWQMLGTMDDDGNTPFTVFWQQALRTIRPERVGAGIDVWLHPDRTRVEQGRDVVLHARLDGSAPQRQVQLVGRVHAAGGRDLPLAFTPRPDDPSRYQTIFVADEPGVYEILAEVHGGGDLLGTAATQIEVVSRPPESADEPADGLALVRLAAATGGRQLALPPDAGEQAAARQERPMERSVTVVDLWSNLALLLVLTLVLGADWLLRLMRGYI
jgi:hypothetical protein